ncbi:MAG: dTDP-4-dehydrorhamnose reductase [Bacteroidales bacterium]|nr:dTDP-4-dehydrorhamnose reductase [Bacteroidales bacterium]
MAGNGGDTRVLVTGSNGQLGMELQRLYKEGRFKEGPILFADMDVLDICNWSDVRSYLGTNRINVVINAAAYTNVEQAETDEKAAYAVNRDGVGVLAQVCAELGIYLVHVSTDYVFDGTQDEPYREDDRPNPTCVYGASKRAGEEEMLKAGGDGLIVRTAWLYSAFGKNFVKTMMRLSREREEVHVVADQFGSPTWARDLAEALLVMIGAGHRAHKRGIEIFHYTNEEHCSWCEFAMAIMHKIHANCVVNPIATSEYPATCRRPMYSVLDKTKIKRVYGLYIPTWEAALEKMLADPELKIQ